jgi:mycothiol synthase
MDKVRIGEALYAVRPACLEDVDLVVELINAAWLVDMGTPGTNRDEKLLEWGLPQFKPTTDSLLVLTAGGQAVGYGEIWDSEPHVRIYQWGRVHPDYRGVGIGQYLVEWGESRARKSIAHAPGGARVSLHSSVNHGNLLQQELFEQSGFHLVRHFFRMLVEMEVGRPPAPPEWPDGVRVRSFEKGRDDRAVYDSLNQAFKDHWGYVEGETFEEWMHWIEADAGFDPTVCFLAVTDGDEGEKVVAALTSRSEWEEDPTIAWIDELGVLRPWRRKGIARALLLHVFGEYHRRGKLRVGLGVDGKSLTGATSLYEQVGMKIMHQFDAYEKVLRPGEDLSTQEL